MNKKQKITVYTSEASNRSIIYHLCEIVKDLPESHELGLRLFKRNIKALYRQSLLGFGWALLPPLATSALWIFLRGNNVISTTDTEIPYAVFVLTGAVLWQIFSEAISAPINQISQNKAMLAKINIPREGLLLSGVYELFFNIAIKLGILIGVYVYFEQTINLLNSLFALIGIVAISIVGLTVGLILTPLGMLYQDVNKALVVLLSFFMYLTPVVYPVPNDGTLALIMKWNPLSVLIVQTRNWLTAQPTYDFQLFWIITLIFFVLFLICLIIYRLSMPMIIERMGS